MKIKVCDYIAKFLKDQQISHVFEMAGGMITQILDAIHKTAYTQIVSVHHEQSAAFAADAYGRCTGKIGVALATSGPGATNLITGIASCYFDSSPAIFITGQVNTHELRGERKIRQLGFQETDIVSMTQYITKKSYNISETNIHAFADILLEAHATAINDRPGPVLIDIPMNMQRVEIEIPDDIISPASRTRSHSGQSAAFDSILAEITQSKMPLILAGGGVNAGRSRDQFIQLVDRLQIPVVTSLLGLDLIPHDHPLRVGFIGSYGNRWANIALGRCDLLLVIGSRLDIRQTGADVKSFTSNKKIIHVDCDEHEINNRLSDCMPVVMDAADFISLLLEKLQQHKLPVWRTWQREIAELKAAWPDTEELKGLQGINPNEFMHALSRQARYAAGYIADVGNHQMWAAQSIEVAKDQFFMTSGGMGAMGFALPASIGASLASGKKPVVVIAGDGGFQLNIQELQTIVRNNIPVKIIVINNKSLGMIRQFQDNYFDGRYQSTYWGYTAPDFAALAAAYGIRSRTIMHSDEISDSAQWLWETRDDPALLQVMVDMRANAYPKIAFGKPITEMEPFTKPISMEGT